MEYISNTGLSPSAAILSRIFFYIDHKDIEVLQPRPKPVWAVPSSLVATTGIFINFLSPATEIFQFADFPLCT